MRRVLDGGGSFLELRRIGHELPGCENNTQPRALARNPEPYQRLGSEKARAFQNVRWIPKLRASGGWNETGSRNAVRRSGRRPDSVLRKIRSLSVPPTIGRIVPSV